MGPTTLKAWKNQLFTVPSGECSLGRVTIAGSLCNSRGAGNIRQRVYGQWAFVYLVEGSGIYEDSLGTRQEVETGNWIMVFPELAHHYGPRKGEHWNEVHVCFQGAVFEQWRACGIFDAARPVGTLEPVAFWWKELAMVFRQLGKKETSSLEALTLWQQWLARILTRHSVRKSGEEQWIEQACRLLDQGMSGEDSGGQRVARQLGMGYENFRKRFVQHTGVPPGRYRETLRIKRAKQLLQSKRLTNKELADMLGFCDEAHFSKTFRRLVGQSSREFRNSLRCH